jgi:hypothetical protein
VFTNVGSVACTAQGEPSGFFIKWEDRVRDTLAEQPSGPTPLISASSGRLQVARTDFVRQIAPAGTDTWNYGNTKGGCLGPWYKVEFDTLAPPYLLHNSSAKDGAGDFSLLLKYRLAAGSADNGDYSVSFSWAGTCRRGATSMGISPQPFPLLWVRAKASDASMCSRRWDLYCLLAIPRSSDVQSCGTPWGQYHIGKFFGRRSKTTRPSTMADRTTAGCRTSSLRD